MSMSEKYDRSKIVKAMNNEARIITIRLGAASVSAIAVAVVPRKEASLDVMV